MLKSSCAINCIVNTVPVVVPVVTNPVSPHYKGVPFLHNLCPISPNRVMPASTGIYFTQVREHLEFTSLFVEVRFYRDILHTSKGTPGIYFTFCRSTLLQGYTSHK